MAELEPSSGLLDPGRARRRPEDDEGPFPCLLDSAWGWRADRQVWRRRRG